MSPRGATSGGGRLVGLAYGVGGGSGAEGDDAGGEYHGDEGDGYDQVMHFSGPRCLVEACVALLTE